MSKVLVAYFSASGNTAKLAKALSRAIGAVLKNGKRFNANAEITELKNWAENFQS